MTRSYNYKAFISYSHSDKVAADRLLNKLENYRVPKRLVGTQGTDGAPIQNRVGQVFRDRDELPAAEDLTAEVKKALTQSEFMIVLCSPAAAASRWVNREIIEFKKLTGERRILSVILSGEPFATDKGQPEGECFPPALRFKLGKNGQLTKTPAEPLAADFRDMGDGERRGLLKLVAGLLGIGLDALIERDLQRKMRRVTAVTAASVGAMLGMGLLTYKAVTAQQEAERQRDQAQGLIVYMLTEVRAKFAEIGRLDWLQDLSARILESAEQQRIEYSQSQEVESIYARAKLAIGIDAEGVGNLENARASYQEYFEASKRLYENDPDNIEKTVAYIEAINRIAITDRKAGKPEAAFAKFEEAERIADAINPNLAERQTDVLKLKAMTKGNLCAGHIDLQRDTAAAVQLCQKALEFNSEAIELEPKNDMLHYQRNFRLRWYSRALEVVGESDQSESLLMNALSGAEQLVAANIENSIWLEQLMEMEIRYAQFLARDGRHENARIHALRAEIVRRNLIALEPANDEWTSWYQELRPLLEKETRDEKIN